VIRYLLILVVLVGCSREPNVRIRRPSTNRYVSDKQPVSNDESRCLIAAQAMADNQRLGITEVIGNYTGYGVGNSPKCETGTPLRRLTLTGDKAVQDEHGRYWRVQSWR
jgi:hypothetical protein